jgi:hypothetical protein
VGVSEGKSDSKSDEIACGARVGKCDGRFVGTVVGVSEGSCVGAFVGESVLELAPRLGAVRLPEKLLLLTKVVLTSSRSLHLLVNALYWK